MNDIISILINMEVSMNYAEIKSFDIANGPGVRVSLFVSGCTHRCKGCFNEIAWDFNFGIPFTEETENELLDKIGNPAISGLTLLGGEPMEPVNQKALLPFIKKVKEAFPDKNIWCYTGYLFDKDIIENMTNTFPETRELISYFDVMVDGEYVEDLRNISLRFRGSENQRIIDVRKSLESGEIIIYEGV